MSIHIRRWVRGLFIVGLLFAVAFFTILPSIAERILNGHDDPATPIASETKALMQDMLISDLHADSLLWGRDLLKKSNVGNVDVPRLIEGGVGLQAFTVVTKTPFTQNIGHNSEDAANVVTLLFLGNRWPSRTWRSLYQRALFQAGRFDEFVRRSDGKLVPIKKASELRAFVDNWSSDSGKVAGFLGIEGLQVLEGDFDNLGRLYDAGYRMMAPTHFFDTEVGGSAHGVSRGGLTEFGVRVIREMERRGIAVDLAHASAAVITDVLKMATKPVLVSHTGIKGTCDNNRNITDEQIRGIATTGGVIGVGFWKVAVCGENAASIANAIDYVAKLVGVDHVALGSDFDGAVKTPFDTTRLDLITTELMKRGFTEQEIAKIMGGNAVRVLLQTLPR